MVEEQSSTGIRSSLARELGRSIVVLAVTGSSVGGVVGILAMATRALGR